MNRNGSSRTVQSVETSCRIIELLAEKEIAGVSEIADELEITKGTVHSYLTTLTNEGLVTRERGRYMLGLRHLSWTQSVLNRMAVNEVIKPELDKLAEKCGERVQYGVEENGEVVYIYRTGGDQALKASFQAGHYEYPHCISIGKAILANYERSKVREIIEANGLPEYTEQTITTIGELFTELESIQSRGYAVDDEERFKGIRCVAVPLLHSNNVFGAISISGPTNRMTEEHINGMYKMLLETSNVIEINKKFVGEK